MAVAGLGEAPVAIIRNHWELSMFVDVVGLREFYSTPLGRVASRSLADAINAIWEDTKGQRIAGLGYCIPWLGSRRADAERAIALMPAAQGAVEWPQGEPSCTVLVFDDQLPLPDASLDCLLMVHLLENCQSPANTLSEAWRVLSPGGRLLIVAPNRRGLWARFEHTPFGTGRPYSRGQLSKLLRDAWLTPTQWQEALSFPPVSRAGLLRFSRGLDRMGRRFWPAFSGVVMVEATKRMYQGIPKQARAPRRVLAPAPALSPGTARNARSSQRR